MSERIEEISIVNIDDMSKMAKEEVERKVSNKPQSFKDNFEGFAKVTTVSASKVRIKSIEPIEGTVVDWFRQVKDESEIDTSDIF